MEAKKNRIVIVLMAANALLFAVVFLALGFFNHLSADDFHYLVTTQERGVWGAMVFYYQNWNPRWASTLVLNTLLLVHRKSENLIVMHDLTLIIGWVSFRILLHGLITQFGLSVSKVLRAVLPLYMLMAIFYVSFAKDDTWFWMSSTPMYLWGIFAVAAGFGFLLMKSPKAWSYLMIFLLFLFVGGSSEPVALVSLLVLFYLGFITRAHQTDRSYHIATIACLVGFGLDALGSGVQVRMEHLPQLPLFDRIVLGFKNYGILLLYRIPMLLPAFVAVLFPLVWIFKNETRFQAVSFGTLFSDNRKVLAVADLVTLTIAFMMGLIMSDLGPSRALLPFVVAMLSTGVILCIQSGEVFQRKFKGKLFIIVLAVQVSLLGYQIVCAAQMIPKAITYSEAVNARMKFIETSISKGDTLLELTPLPNSGWLYSAELSNDTSNFRNRHLQLYFGNKIRLFIPQDVPSDTE